MRIVPFENNILLNKISTNSDLTSFILSDLNIKHTTAVFTSNEISSIRTSAQSKNDFFHWVLSLLSSLSEGYSSRYQVTLVPATNYWKDRIKKRDLWIQNYKESGHVLKQDEKKQSASLDRNRLDFLGREKVTSSKWYFVILRSFFCWPDERVLDSKINGLKHMLTWLNNDKTHITFLDEKDSFLSNYYTSKLLPITISKWSLMVESELTTIIHPPIPNNINIQNIDTQLFQKLPMPPEIIKSVSEFTREDVVLWSNDYGWANNYFSLNHDARFRHIYTLWKSWVWKSTFMETAVLQDIYNWYWVCVIDPHWDLIDDIMSRFPDPRNPKYKDRYKDLIYIDFWDTDNAVWLNISEAENEFDEAKSINAFISLLKKIYPDSWESMWPYFEDYIRNSFRTILKMKHIYKPTITDIIRLLQNDEYRADAVSHFDPNADIDLMGFWENHENQTWEWSQSANKDEIIPHVRTKFSPFLTNKYVKNVTGQEDTTVDFFEAMNTNKIILVKLSKWSIWTENMVILWQIFMAKLLNDVFKRDKLPKDKRNPFFLYVDEFQNFINKEFEELFSEARKYNFWMTVANQYLWQLVDKRTKDDSVLKSVFWNAWTFVAFKVGSDDTAKLEEHFWNRQLLPKEAFGNIEKYYAYVHTGWSSNVVKSIAPFTIKTLISNKPKIKKRDEKGRILEDPNNPWKHMIDYDLINKIINHSKSIYTRWEDVIAKHDLKFSKLFE